jgi:hypothetical protein
MRAAGAIPQVLTLRFALPAAGHDLLSDLNEILFTPVKVVVVIGPVADPQIVADGFS